MQVLTVEVKLVALALEALPQALVVVRDARPRRELEVLDEPTESVRVLPDANRRAPHVRILLVARVPGGDVVGVHIRTRGRRVVAAAAAAPRWTGRATLAEAARGSLHRRADRAPTRRRAEVVTTGVRHSCEGRVTDARKEASARGTGRRFENAANEASR